MDKRKVIIDCDPGIDDCMALMLALSSPELDVVAVTAVCGNVPVETGGRNARKILNAMGRTDIPVYRGADRPLRREYITAQDTHGTDGLGDCGIEELPGGVLEDGAVDVLLELVKRERGISIIAIGPMTNLALALQRDETAFSCVGEVVSMGGSYKSHGNCSPVAEYNYWCDPDAADYVYQHLGKKIHMVGLDVTRQVVLTPNLLTYMKYLNPERGALLERITKFYFDFHWKQEGLIGCVINDPLAVAYLINPELCGGFDSYTAVETEGISIGQTVVDAMDFYHRAPNSRILTEVDVYGFMQMLTERLCGGDPKEIAVMLKRLIVPE